MTVCMCPGCQTSAGCKCGPAPIFTPAQSPRFLPVNLPLPSWGLLTIAQVDEYGNVSIRVDQPKAEMQG